MEEAGIDPILSFETDRPNYDDAVYAIQQRFGGEHVGPGSRFQRLFRLCELAQQHITAQHRTPAPPAQSTRQRMEQEEMKQDYNRRTLNQSGFHTQRSQTIHAQIHERSQPPVQQRTNNLIDQRNQIQNLRRNEQRNERALIQRQQHLSRQNEDLNRREQNQRVNVQQMLDRNQREIEGNRQFQRELNSRGAGSQRDFVPPQRQEFGLRSRGQQEENLFAQSTRIIEDQRLINQREQQLTAEQLRKTRANMQAQTENWKQINKQIIKDDNRINRLAPQKPQIQLKMDANPIPIVEESKIASITQADAVKAISGKAMGGPPINIVTVEQKAPFMEIKQDPGFYQSKAGPEKPNVQEIQFQMVPGKASKAPFGQQREESKIQHSNIQSKHFSNPQQEFESQRKGLEDIQFGDEFY